MLVVERFRPGRRKMTERKKREKKNWWNWIFSLVWERIEVKELANEVKASEELENSTGLGQKWVRAHFQTK